MKTSDQMINIMKHHEGVRYRPYLCPAHIWTIGVGHAMYDEQLRMPFKNSRSFALRPKTIVFGMRRKLMLYLRKTLKGLKEGYSDYVLIILIGLALMHSLAFLLTLV